MLSELQRRKLTRMFRLFDRDGDGAIAWADYARVSARMLDVLELAPDSTEGAEMAASYRVEWEELALEPGAGVHLPRWLAYRAEQLSMRDAFEINIAPYVLTIATHIDRDGDGFVGGDDLRRYLALYDMPDAERAAAVARLDPTGRGRIPYVELEDRAREFYYSNNPEAPGSWFLGPF